MTETVTQALSKTKILFATEDGSPDVAEAALSTGARGFAVKSDVGKEPLPAAEAVLRGERFIRSSLHERAEKGIEES